MSLITAIGSTLYSEPIDFYLNKSLLTDEGASYSCAKSYFDSFQNMSQMGEIMEGILTSSSSGNTATITKVFQDFIQNVLSAVVDPLKIIGIGLATFFLIITLYRLAMEDRMNPEIFVKHFGKLALSIGFICYSDILIEYIINFSNGLADFSSGLALGGKTTNSMPQLLDLCNVFYSSIKSGKIDSFGLIFSTYSNGFIVSIVSGALIVVSYIIAFSRMIEIAIRAAGMPVAMGLISDDGWAGAGGRYIKKFVAICCQSFVLILIAKVTTGIIIQSTTSLINELQGVITSGSGDVHSTLYGGLMISIGVGIASITAMHKSIGFVNDMFGA